VQPAQHGKTSSSDALSSIYHGHESRCCENTYFVCSRTALGFNLGVPPASTVCSACVTRVKGNNSVVACVCNVEIASTIEG